MIPEANQSRPRPQPEESALGTETPRMRVTVIGYGAVGRPLTRALAAAGAHIVDVGERVDSERVGTAQQDGFHVLPVEMVRTDVDLLILAVGDPSIAGVASLLAENIPASSTNPQAHSARATVGDAAGAPPVAMHLSGRMNLAPLAPLAGRGFSRMAWHPMQTFPPDASTDRFRGIVAGVTADETAVPVAERLAVLLGARTMRVEEKDRSRYHLASVIASNFLPLLLDLGASCLDGVAESREEGARALLPLVRGMVESLDAHGPEGAMTGPVARDDLQAVQQHGQAGLTADERSLYFALTLALVDLARRSGRISEERAAEWVKTLAGSNGRS